jgi:hypothetical protein
LSPHDLERPATASEAPGTAPWSAKDHFAHLVSSERNGQRLLRAILAGESRDALLRLRYSEGMPLPVTLGDWDALTPEEWQLLEPAVADLNQAYVDARHDDSMEQIAADYLTTRRDTMDLLRRFTDRQLTAPLPTVVGEQTPGDFLARSAMRPATHISWIKQG